MFEKFGQDLVLLERLASGGMGEVYRAKQLGQAGFDKTVAVKMILQHYASQPEFKAMFEQEMRLCAKLQHPNIGQVYTSGESNGCLYLSMEFLDGKTLRDIIQQCQSQQVQIPIELCCLIAAEVAKGLNYAHNLQNEQSGDPLKLVHRDISPQNIMVGYNGEVKILDFGVAKAADSLDLTKPGDIKGNLGYVAPEAIEGMVVDSRADIFSLGVVTFELLTLTKLFVGQSSLATLANIRTKEIPSISSIRKEVPHNLIQIIMKALTRERELRYQSVEGFQRELSTYIGQNFPGLVSNDLGNFVSKLFSEIREKEHKERKLVNELWQQARSRHQLPTPMKTTSFNVLIGKRSEESEERTKIASMSLPKKSNSKIVLLATPILLILLIGSYFYNGKLSRLLRFNYDPVSYFDPSILTQSGPVDNWQASNNPKIIAMQDIPDSRPNFIPATQEHPAYLNFDGVDDYLSVPNLVEILKETNELSVLLAARIASADKQTYWSMHLWDKHTDLVRTGIETFQEIFIKWNKPYRVGELRASSEELVDKWVVISTIFEQDMATVFLNAKMILQTRLDNKLDYNTAKYFSIGQEYDDGIPTDFLKGDIADFIVYDYALNIEKRIKQEKIIAEKLKINLINELSP